MSDEQKNNGVDDSMEEILASIRETVEDEVAKTSSAEEGAATPKTGSGTENLDNDILNDVLGETADANEDDSEDVNIDDILAAASNSADKTAEPTEEKSADSEDFNIDDILGDVTAEVEAEAQAAPAKETTDDVTEASTEEEDDVLELTDMLPVDENVEKKSDDMIDVNAFSNDGSIKDADASDVNAAESEYNKDKIDAVDTAVDSIPEDAVEAVAAEPNPEQATELPEENSEDEDDMASTAEKIVEEDVTEIENELEVTPTQTDSIADKVVPMVAAAINEDAERKVHLRTQPSATGLSVSFPSEILAEALRPLVTDWIEENLSDIVERLVREELSKLADK